MTIEDIRPSGEILLLREALEIKVKQGIDKNGIWRHQKRDGTLIDVEITSCRLGFGGIDAEVVLAHDVTDRPKAGAQPRLVVKIFEQSTEGFVITDADNHIIMVNQAFSAITGYSSMSYLKRFKVYKLKIDRSFVSDVTQNSEDKAIVRAIINLSRILGFQTIDEGVETEEQLLFCVSMDAIVEK